MVWLSEQPTHRTCCCGIGSEGIKSDGSGALVYTTFARKSFIFKGMDEKCTLGGGHLSQCTVRARSGKRCVA